MSENKVGAIIYVNQGKLTADSFTTPSTVTGLAVGPDATAGRISVTDSSIGKIEIDENNTDTGIYDEIMSGNTADAEITTGFDAATMEEFESALTEFGRVRLTGDIQIFSDEETAYVLPKAPNNTYDIDLNGNLLDIQSHGCFDIQSNTNVTFRNGKLNTNWIEEGPEKNEASDMGMLSDSTLNLINVDYTSEGTAIYIKKFESNVTLNVKDSTITAGGSYGISTNADKKDNPHSENINITIDNSDVTSTFATNIGSTGIMLNVPGTLIVKNDSVIKGTRNGITLRGGEADISNSQIISTGEFDDTDIADEYLNGDWGTDVQAPYAALLVGNRTSNSYVYATTCTITDSEIINYSDSQYASRIYVASSNEQTVTFTSSQYTEEVKETGSYYQEEGSSIVFN